VAGGWFHLTDQPDESADTYDRPYRGAVLLENGGDVEEACEQLYGMVQWLAAQLAARSGTTREEQIEQANRQWRAGLELGGDAR
jgi:hypothetical protein